jgi:methionine sulfoxide reductase heme-binding subunit
VIPVSVWPDALWYVARGLGLTALVLLTVAVALGVASRSGRPAFGLPRFAVTAVHRNASVMALGLVVLHVLILLADPHAKLSPVDVVVPFAGPYQVLWLGLGTLALDCTVAVVVTSLLRHRLGLRGWRAVHWLAYAAWPAAVLHGLGVGSDSSELWLRVTVACCVAVVAGALVWRLRPGFAQPDAARPDGARPDGVRAGRR